MLTTIFVVVCLEYLNKKRRWQLFKVNRIETRYVCGASGILFVDGVILLVFAEVIARLQRFCKIHSNHPPKSVKIAFFTVCNKYCPIFFFRAKWKSLNLNKFTLALSNEPHSRKY